MPRSAGVRVSCEFLPAMGQARQELVLLHGWGSVPAIWRTVLTDLRPWADIRLLEIPGCAAGAPAGLGTGAELQDSIEAILEQCPDRAVYIGWSLGGQVATAIANQYPARVAAVVTLCSNPRFVQTIDWPGMDTRDFDAFRASFSEDPAAGLRRFDSLQVAGSSQARQRMRELRSLNRPVASERLLPGLDWLATLDLVGDLKRLQCPQLHLLGTQDQLVPVDLAASLETLLSETADSKVVLLEGCSHVATLDDPGGVSSAIAHFLEEVSLLQPCRRRDEAVSKRDISESFSRAAPKYDSVAQLQREVGDGLLKKLDRLTIRPRRIVDLGCGTGYFSGELCERFPQAHYLGVDIAPGMVQYARGQQAGARDWLVGDAEFLPLASQSVDLVFSSLAVQWCQRPKLLLAELIRVLRPGGRCVFTSLGPGTLGELRKAWAEVDDHQHVNRFAPTEELEAAMPRVGGARLLFDGEQYRMQYRSVRELLNELKTLGAHNMNRDRPGGLTSRSALQGMLQAYERFRINGLLPATYDVIYGTLEV